jgi:hypothetical protein
MGTGSGTSAWDTSPTFKGAVTVGVDDTGHDVKFFGATSGKYMEWDESADQLNVVGSLNVTGNTQMTGTLTVGVDDTGHDVIFYGATTSNAWFWWDESADNLLLGPASKLGLGTNATTPAATPLHVNNATPTFTISDTGNNYAQDDVQCTIHMAGRYHSGTANPLADAYSDAKIQLFKDNSDGSGGSGLSFWTSATGGGGLTKQLSIGKSGDVTFTGKLNMNSLAASAASEWANLNHSYGMYVDNTGPGSANTRMWFNGVDGAALYIGPRSGSHTWDYIRIAASSIVLLGTVSKTAGSFDIAHPSRGGDWRLRHSFIEGPTADNIYRGTTTISGDSATIDLDTVSGMTDGTWLALNTNPWTMVASSGNAVTWSLSGKTLTINGPDGAVCSWMVIGERKDQGIVDSPMTDSNGKLVVEYEDAERDACPED